jgi:hypothetical protein
MQADGKTVTDWYTGRLTWVVWTQSDEHLIVNLQQV